MTKVLIFCLFFSYHGLVLKLGPFPSDLLPPQSLSGWIMPKFKPNPLRICSNLTNAQLVVPSPLPGRFPIPSQKDFIPSQNKISHGCGRLKAAHPSLLVLHPSKIQPRGFIAVDLRMKVVIPGNSRDPLNSRLNFLASLLLPSWSRGKDEDEH